MRIDLTPVMMEVSHLLLSLSPGQRSSLLLLQVKPENCGIYVDDEGMSKELTCPLSVHSLSICESSATVITGY